MVNLTTHQDQVNNQITEIQEHMQAQMTQMQAQMTQMQVQMQSQMTQMQVQMQSQMTQMQAQMTLIANQRTQDLALRRNSLVHNLNETLIVPRNNHVDELPHGLVFPTSIGLILSLTAAAIQPLEAYYGIEYTNMPFVAERRLRLLEEYGIKYFNSPKYFNTIVAFLLSSYSKRLCSITTCKFLFEWLKLKKIFKCCII